MLVRNFYFAFATFLLIHCQVIEGFQAELAVPSDFSIRHPDARQKFLDHFGGNEKSQKSVELALEWMANQQLPDGSWSVVNAGPKKDVAPVKNAATGIALLTFLAEGQSHQEGKYQQVIHDGLTYLLQNGRQRGDTLSWHEQGGTMYSHAIATMAVAEAFALTEDELLLPSLQKSIKFIEEAQDNIGGGWRYMPRQAGDVSVSGWQILALEAASHAGVYAQPATLNNYQKFLSNMSFEDKYFGYVAPPQVKNGKADEGRATTTAIGLYGSILMGTAVNDENTRLGTDWVSDIGPSIDSKKNNSTNMYHNFHATNLMKTTGGDTWRAWHEPLRDFLVREQEQNGVNSGSWWFGSKAHAPSKGGRHFETAFACLILQSYYRLPATRPLVANE